MALNRHILALLAALCLGGCGKEAVPTTAPSATSSTASVGATVDPNLPRVVSTVPAATLNMILIGAADRLVGVTKYDVIYLPDAQRDLPVVGDYETMNYERLVSLHPTAVVVQTTEARISGRLRDLAAADHFKLVNIKMDTLDDLWNTAVTLGQISGHETEALATVRDAKEQLKLMAIAIEGKPRPRVLYVTGNNPLFIAGADTFMDQMVTLAGGENLGAKVGKGFPVISNETLVKLTPDVLLVSAPDQPPQQENDSRLESWSRLPIPAVWNNRIFLVTDGNALMASVELPKQVQGLAKLIHHGETQPATTSIGGGHP